MGRGSGGGPGFWGGGGGGGGGGVGWGLPPRPVPGAGPSGAAGVQYLRLQLDLITTGTDSVCLVVPSLAQKVMVNEEFSARPDGMAVTA
jgi:hypothetical protein